MKDRQEQVKAYVPSFLKAILVKLAEERKIKMSELIGNMLINQVAIGKYQVLTKTEMQYVELKKNEIQTGMLKYIRSKSAEKITFMKNVKRQMGEFSNYAGKNKQELIENMKLNLQISEVNGWTEISREIKEIIKKGERLNGKENLQIQKKNNDEDRNIPNISLQTSKLEEKSRKGRNHLRQK